MYEFRRGSEAIAKANESAKSGGSFTPFLSNFYWKEDQEVKYLWILNPLEDIPLVQMIKAWTTDDRTEFVIARTEGTIGESVEPIEDKWGYGPQELNVCIVAEVKAVMETVHGRPRPVSFEVATRTFERKLRDAKGEATGGTEEVTVPVVGMVAQSPNNCFNHISSKDANRAPIHEFAMSIRRLGTDKNTEYEVELFDDVPLDKENLLQFFDGLSYLSEEEMDDLIAFVDGTDVESNDPLNEDEAAIAIGEALLNKKLNEMADPETYKRVLGSIDTVAQYPSKKYKSAHGQAKDDDAKTDRPARPSQKRSRRAERSPETTEATTEGDAPAADPEPKEKPKRGRRPKSEPTVSNTVTKESPVRARLEELKAKTEAKAKAA